MMMTEETDWVCKHCAHWNTSMAICAQCGRPLAEPEETLPLTHRPVFLDDIARILSLIHAPPNLRQQPRPGDIEGDFDEWFDGGARQFVTGHTQYQFSDGSSAVVQVTPKLHLSIRCSNGETVHLQQP